mgnify:CR=1 FL=1
MPILVLNAHDLMPREFERRGMLIEVTNQSSLPATLDMLALFKALS